MPRRVDVDQKRRDLFPAVLRIVADEGLHAVTFARASQASGVSVSAIRHNWETLDKMLAFAAHHAAERRLARSPRWWARPEARIGDTLAAHVPMTEEQVVEDRAWAAFVTIATVDGSKLAQLVADHTKQRRGNLMGAMRWYEHRHHPEHMIGLRTPDLGNLLEETPGVRRATAEAQALVRGLTAMRCDRANQFPVEEVRPAIDRFVANLDSIWTAVWTPDVNDR